ncbi:winged helix-turn-helix domain-containing protein [Pantoea sp.]|uniref:winged helix-turn-helix domain-containing protein n=1 Tax=Pantoea sp. TaxID=69393 RepID=UPI0031DC1BE6
MRIGRNGQFVTLNENNLRCLAILLQFEGEVVPRDMIMAACWGDKGRVVTDASLRKVINNLRQLFINMDCKKEIIITRPRHGYWLRNGYIKRLENEPLLLVEETKAIPVSRSKTIKPDFFYHKKKCFLNSPVLLVLRLFSVIFCIFVTFTMSNHLLKHLDHFLIANVNGHNYSTQHGEKTSQSHDKLVTKLEKYEVINTQEYRHIYLNRTFTPNNYAAFICQDSLSFFKPECLSLLITN